MPKYILQSSRVAVLAVVSVLASVLASGVASSPVSANGNIYYADSSACEGDAAESAGFSDIAGSTHEAAINCLAYYDITKGTSDGRYNGGGTVTRWHMALFMTRASKISGAELEEGTPQGFTDIGELTSDVQTAVNQAVATGLTEGRTSTTFDPHAAVTRAEMAVWVNNLLRRSIPDKDGYAGAEKMDKISLSGSLGNFPDIRELDKPTYEAIRRLYVMGISKGTTSTTYTPSSPVTRAQMASFITRALAHTIARPAGVSVELSYSRTWRDWDLWGDPDLHISIYDDNYRPYAGARFNVMVVETKNIDKAFTSDGTCDTSGAFFENTEACTVTEEHVTDHEGSYVYRNIVSNDKGVTEYTIYVWTPDTRANAPDNTVGTTFDSDLYPASTVTFAVLEDPDRYEITTNLAEGVTRAGVGDTVRVTLQLLDTDNIPEGATANPVRQANVVFYVNERHRAFYRGSAGLIEEIHNRTRRIWTDADGRLTIPVKVDESSIGIYVFEVAVILTFTPEREDLREDMGEQSLTVTFEK